MGWSLQNLSSLFSKVATDGACITTSGRLFHVSVDRGMNEYVLWFRRILSLNILCWCLVWLHKLYGTDTTSAAYRRGKAQACHLRRKRPDLRVNIAIFYNKDVSQEEIASAGERFVLAWYGAEKFPH